MSKTLMEHRDHGLRRVPLNEWARYRKAGWVFANDKAKTIAELEMDVRDAKSGQLEAEQEAEQQAKQDPDTEEEVEVDKKPRTTKPKSGEED